MKKTTEKNLLVFMPLSSDFMRRCHDIRRRTMDGRPRSLWARVRHKCAECVKALPFSIDNR